MLTLIFITSLKIVFMYGAMQEGNVLSWLRILFIRLLMLTPLWFEQYAKKPLYDCLFCMGSVWGITFTFQYFSFTWWYLTLLFGIAGCNYMLALLIGYVHTYQEAMGERIEIKAPALPEPAIGQYYDVYRDGKYLDEARYVHHTYHGYVFMNECTGNVFADVDYWVELDGHDVKDKW